MMFINIALTYLCFKYGMPPLSYAVVMLITYIILALIVQPVLVVTQTEYKYKDIYLLYWQCVRVTIIAIIIPFLSYICLPHTGDFSRILLLSLVSLCSVCISVWYIGIDKEIQERLIKFIIQKTSLK